MLAQMKFILMSIITFAVVVLFVGKDEVKAYTHSKHLYENAVINHEFDTIIDKVEESHFIASRIINKFNGTPIAFDIIFLVNSFDECSNLKNYSISKLKKQESVNYDDIEELYDYKKGHCD